MYEVERSADDALMEQAADRPFACDQCAKRFRTMGALQTHARVHTGERPHACPACGKHFAQKGGLLIHMRLHSGEKPYECPVCARRFTQKGQLMVHADRMHPGDERVDCGRPRKARPATSPSSLHMHIKEEEEEEEEDVAGGQPQWSHRQSSAAGRLHQCAQCGKAFTSNCALKTHTRTHTGERPFRCDMCGKSFNQKGHLKVHERLHTGERPFKCGQCDEAFRQKTHLVAHQRLHTGERERRWHCADCGLRFARRAELAEHRREHESIDGALLYGDERLHWHQLTHGGGGHAECGKCGRPFGTVGELHTHLLHAHTDLLHAHAAPCGIIDVESTSSHNGGDDGDHSPMTSDDEEPDIMS